MLHFKVGKGRFVLRTAGVAFHNNRVLIHKTDDMDFWALPGGRVQHLETTEEALRREMQEETGSPIHIERLLWVVENFFQDEEKGSLWSEPTHELGFYYLFQFPHNSHLYEKDTFIGAEGSQPLIFEWHPVNTLEQCELYPEFLRKDLQTLPKAIAHKRIREGKLA